MSTEMVTIPRTEYQSLKKEVKLFRNSNIYKRLLEFERNTSSGKKYYRKDLGF